MPATATVYILASISPSWFFLFSSTLGPQYSRFYRIMHTSVLHYISPAQRHTTPHHAVIRVYRMAREEGAARQRGEGGHTDKGNR